MLTSELSSDQTFSNELISWLGPPLVASFRNPNLTKQP